MRRASIVDWRRDLAPIDLMQISLVHRVASSTTLAFFGSGSR
jgi:hypothetical protein